MNCTDGKDTTEVEIVFAGPFLNEEVQTPEITFGLAHSGVHKVRQVAAL